jgi:hypothetical protein
LKENCGYRNEGRVVYQGLTEQWPLLLTVKQAEVTCSFTNKIDKFYVHVTVHRDTFPYNKTNQMH